MGKLVLRLLLLLSTDALVRLLLSDINRLRDAGPARAEAALAPAHLLEHLVAHVIRTQRLIQPLAPRRVLVDPSCTLPGIELLVGPPSLPIILLGTVLRVLLLIIM